MVGSFSYTPGQAFYGVDSFTYRLFDGAPYSNVAMVTIAVSGVNHAPIAVGDTITTAYNTNVTIDVLANDSDPDGDPLTVTSVTQPGNGIVAIGADGTVTYWPFMGFSGSDSFTYFVSDGNGGTATAAVSVTVNPAPNQVPVVQNDFGGSPPNTAVRINVLANDSDPDGDRL